MPQSCVRVVKSDTANSHELPREMLLFHWHVLSKLTIVFYVILSHSALLQQQQHLLDYGSQEAGLVA